MLLNLFVRIEYLFMKTKRTSSVNIPKKACEYKNVLKIIFFFDKSLPIDLM